MSETKQKASIRVWDPIVRYGHWVLVAAFFVAYLSAEEESSGPDLVHVWGGYVVGIIVVLRVAWGFVGTPYARFSNFAYRPAKAIAYLADLTRDRGHRYVGHSPAGGAMVFALLVCLALTVGTGLVAYGERGNGPLAVTGGAAMTQAYAESGEGAGQNGSAQRGERTESVIGEMHGTIANITLGLIILHVLGVAVASIAHRENLVAAMITGRKRLGN